LDRFDRFDRLTPGQQTPDGQDRSGGLHRQGGLGIFAFGYDLQLCIGRNLVSQAHAVKQCHTFHLIFWDAESSQNLAERSRSLDRTDPHACRFDI